MSNHESDVIKLQGVNSFTRAIIEKPCEADTCEADNQLKQTINSVDLLVVNIPPQYSI